MAVYPTATLATGDAAKALGNGRPSWQLPIWIQKSWGGWTTNAGGGYVVNHAEGQRDYPFGGWLVTRAIGETFTVGGEVFALGKSTFDGRAMTLVNFGGVYKFTPHFSLLVSAGHSISGNARTVAYASLWWSWGGDKQNAVLALPHPK